MQEERQEFTIKDMIENNLIMGDGAKQRRIVLGEELGIGYTNAKQFLSRLNHYGIKREEFQREVDRLDGRR